MHSNGPSGRVTSSTGNIDEDGQVLGYRGTGTMIDPGPPVLRPDFETRSRAVIIAATPELVDEQLAGIRRMLAREVVIA